MRINPSLFSSIFFFFCLLHCCKKSVNRFFVFFFFFGYSINFQFFIAMHSASLKSQARMRIYVCIYRRRKFARSLGSPKGNISARCTFTRETFIPSSRSEKDDTKISSLFIAQGYCVSIFL